MTAPNPGRILIVDDEFELMTALSETLIAHGYTATGLVSPQEAVDWLREQDVDILLCDLMMPEMDGITLLRAALDIDPHLVGIVMTGQGTVQTAVDAMKVGAFDYVLKPFRLSVLLPLLDRALHLRQLRLENMHLRETVAIYELQQTIAYTPNVNTILRQVVDGAMQQVNADEASIMLPAPDGEALFVAAVRGKDREGMLGQRIPMAQSITGWVASHRQPLTLHGAVSDPRFVPLKPRHDITAVVLPMLSAGNLIGVLCVNATRRRRPFMLGRVKALSTLANLAASALANASMYTQLRQSEERFRSVTESAIDAIMLANHNGTIMAWNESAHLMFGYAQDDIVGRPLTLLIPERYRAACLDEIQRVAATGPQHAVRKTVGLHGLKQDGSVFPLELSLSSWQTDDGTFFSAIIRDISERKKAEEELQRQREAVYQAEKLATMGQLLAGVAHELNNPLSVVLGQATLLAHTAGSKSLGERAQEITRAAERCARIVRNFLALARRHPPEKQPLHLNQIVQEAVELLAYTLRIEAVEVRLHLAAKLPILWADANQLHQVVVNLISNAHQAMQATPPPRQLILTTWCDQAQTQVYLEAADTGPGIPSEIAARIFEPFFTTKPPGLGTGLGLSLCQGIIEGHGGTLQVTSQPGHGAVFRIEIPVQAPPVVLPTTTTAVALLPVQGKTILVVDDEPTVADVLVDILSIDGHQVETAANGVIALNKLQERAYDLILTDLRMPELDGPGLYWELTHRHPRLQQQIIFLTGDALSPQAQSFLEQTQAPSLSKPFTLEEVRRIIQRTLRE